MKRDIFRRGVRFQHKFGTLEETDSPFFGPKTFEFEPPVRVSDLSKPGAMPPCHVQEYGEHTYAPARSAVVKPGGEPASINGPSPDLAEFIGRPIPVGTKRRLGPLKTDK